MSQEQEETIKALQSDWGLQPTGYVSEEELLHLLAERVIAFLEKGPETFFQLMYRLDIAENKLNAVLNSPDAAMKIAKLIYERQLQKIKSRTANKQSGNPEDPELNW